MISKFPFYAFAYHAPNDKNSDATRKRWDQKMLCTSGEMWSKKMFCNRIFNERKFIFVWFFLSIHKSFLSEFLCRSVFSFLTVFLFCSNTSAALVRFSSVLLVGNLIQYPAFFRVKHLVFFSRRHGTWQLRNGNFFFSIHGSDFLTKKA